MDAPPLSVIQANVLLCLILFCSKGEKAYKIAFLHHARSISVSDGIGYVSVLRNTADKSQMAERAGLFEPSEPQDFQSLQISTFDWSSWVDMEMRRRLACQIFCSDIGRCVFTKWSPYLSPSDFPVQLPCFDNCWEAMTASECLQSLKLQPEMLSVTSAIKRVREASEGIFPLFEAPAFGMLAVLIGLSQKAIFYCLSCWKVVSD